MFGKRNIAVVPVGSNGPCPSDQFAAVQNYPLFFGVPPADYATIISSGHEKHLYRHQTLFSIGDPVEQVFLLLSGAIKITQVGSSGNEVILRVSGAYELVGTLDPWRECQHNFSAQVLQTSTALVWDSATFAKLLGCIDGLLANVIGILEDRLQEMEQRFREVSTGDVPSRVSSELLRLSIRFGCDNNGNGRVQLTHTELAELTGSSLPTVSRLLNRWKRLGIVSVGREGVQIRDFVALKQFTRSPR